MEEWRWILWVAGIFVVLRLAPLLMMVPAILRLRLQPSECERIDPAELPSEVRRFFESCAEPLLALGFEPVGMARVRDVLDAAGEASQHAYLQHPETGTFASIVPSHLPDHRLPCRIDLDTPLADGRMLTTVNALGHLAPESMRELEMHEVACLTERELWDAHRARLEELGPSERIDFDPYLERCVALSRATLDHMRASGMLVHDPGDDRARLRLGAAFRFARRALAGQRSRERLMKARGGEIAEGRLPDRPIELWQEVAGYVRAQRAVAHPIAGSARLAILLFSAVAFVLAMSLILGFVGACCLLGVVALHELGHYAAMRMLRYRDTSVFFVPFLGAATTGSKPDATLGQEIVVLLAGPLPGLALGIGLVFARPEWLAHDAARLSIVMLVVINLLNLLPVMPLDGGKAVERILLAGRPRASLAVGVAGVAGLAALALWAGDPILAVFCVLFALGVRSQFTGMRLAERVRAAAPDACTEAERARATFEVLGSDAKRSFAQKFQLARLVEAHWRRPGGGRAVRAAWLAGYGACLAGAFAGSAAALVAARPSGPPDVDFTVLRARWLDPGAAEPVACDATGVPDDVAGAGGDRYWERYVLFVCG